ncbi:MAG: diguanylate cyclase domain-containing protein [Acidimicrobiales bacterium]
MDRRALPGLVAGLAGMVAGTVAATWNHPLWALIAAACSLVAGGACLDLVRRLQDADARPPGGPPDAETGLPAAWGLEDALSSKLAVARRQLWPVTVVQLAIEPGPKEISGRLEALGGLAGLLRLALRESDLAMRVGENRFVLILDDTNEEGGVWAVERLQEALGRELSSGLQLVAGLASYPTHGLSGRDILLQSEAALHRALSQATDGRSGPVAVAPIEPA